MSSAPPSAEGAPSRPGAPSARVQLAPYKLFDYFVEDDKDRFYGRERDVEDIVDRIVSGRTLVLYGRSGIGKTSLLRAGVIPTLTERRFQVAYVRLLRSPLDDLRAQVAAALDRAPGPLAELVAACPRPVVILLDQFEELFIRFPELDDRRALAAELTALLTTADEAGRPLDVRVVLSLRQDYVAELDELGPSWSDLLDRRYRLRGLSAFGARRAIAQPLAEKKIAHTPALVNQLVDDLSEKGFDPLLLQILCSEVYRAAELRDPNEVRLTAEDYKSVGGTDGIFLRYLDGVTAAVPDDARILLRLVLDALITDQRTKCALTLDGLLAARFRATKEEVEPILTRLAEGRLVRAQPRGEETWYELVHDRLVEVVLGWLEKDRDFVELRFARSLVEELSRSGRWREDPHALLSRGQIESAVGPYRKYLRLEAEEEEFLFWSAVVARSDEELLFWAGRCGLPIGVERVLALFEHPEASVRGGAAWAASALKESDPRLAPRCLAAALHDPDRSVQRTAGRSFAAIAKDQEIAELLIHLRAPSTREAATEILADVLRGGRSLGGFSLRQRAAARRLAEKRIRARHSEEMSGRERSGVIVGIAAAVVWLLTIGFGLAYLAAELADPGDALTDIVWSLIGGLLLIVAPSAGCADLAVRTAFYAEHLRGHRHFSRAARSRWVVAWFGVPLFFCLIVPLAEASGPSVLAEWIPIVGVAFAAAAATVAVVAASVALAERALAGLRDPRAMLATALGAALGLPILAPVLVARALLPRYAGEGGAIVAGAALAAAAASAFTAVLVAVLGRDALRAEAPTTPGAPRHRRVAALGIVLLTTTMLAWGGAALWSRPDMLPLTAPTVDLRQLDETRSLPLSTGFPDGHWLRFDAGNDLFVVEVPEIQYVEVLGAATTSYYASASPLFGLVVPPGARPIAFSATVQQLSSFRFGPAHRAEPAAGAVAVGRELVYLRVALQRSSEANANAYMDRWIGRITGSLREPSAPGGKLHAFAAILGAGSTSYVASLNADVLPILPGRERLFRLARLGVKSVVSAGRETAYLTETWGDGRFDTGTFVVEIGAVDLAQMDRKPPSSVELVVAIEPDPSPPTPPVIPQPRSP